MTRSKSNKLARQLTLEHLSQRVLLDASGFLDPVFYEVTPYLSEADVPAGFIPVDDCPECVYEIETFEDGTLDHGITITDGEIIPPGFETGLGDLTDSVDGDDGVIDGTGQTNEGGYSYFTSGNSITVTLPGIMQSAGAVWTDGATSLTDVTFEAFDENGDSLGLYSVGDLADDSIMGTTAEDTFLGFSYGDGVTTGITRFTITNVGGLGLEIDHIQFANCSECCEIDLELEKTVDSEFVESGDVVTWTIELTNNADNATVAATGVQVTDLIPAGLQLQSVSVTDGDFDSGSGVWTLESAIEPGQTETLTLVTQIADGLSAGTMIVNTAQVTAANEDDVDSTPGNDDGDQSEDDEASAKVTVGALIDLELTKSVATPVVTVGDRVRWNIEITNNEENANAAATGVVVTDLVPDGVTVFGVTKSSGLFDFDTMSWTLTEPLEPGATETLTIVTIVDSDVTNGTMLTNVAYVSAANETDVDSTPGDADLSEDDADDAKVTVEVPQPELMLSGYSYVDTNNDGIFQDIELPLMGVEIVLTGTDVDGNDVNESTFTNIDGFYKFNDLAPGTYTVMQMQPLQFLDGKDTLGNLGGEVPANDKLTVELTDNGEEYNFGELGLLPEYVNKRLYLNSTPYTDWQYIDVRQSSIWYSFNADHQAFIEANAIVTDGNVSLALLNGDMETIAEGAGVLSVVAPAGQYYLVVSGDTIVESLTLDVNSPAVAVDGDTVTVVASDGDDEIELHLGDTTHVLSIAGMDYEFDAATISTFSIDGSGGDDSVTVHGTDLDDTGSSIGLTGALHSSDYHVSTAGFESTTFVGGGGNDYTQVYGSLLDDTFYSLPQEAKLTTPDSQHIMLGFERVDGYGRGGNDYGSLYGTLGDDLYISRDRFTLIKGDGHMGYTKGFERIDSFGRGGNDVAELHGTTGDDKFISTDKYAALITEFRITYTKGFESLSAHAVAGGTDTAHYFGLLSGDEFTGAGNLAAVARAITSRTDSAYGFEKVDIYASEDESPELTLAAIDYILNEDIVWV